MQSPIKSEPQFMALPTPAEITALDLSHATVWVVPHDALDVLIRKPRMKHVESSRGVNLFCRGVCDQRVAIKAALVALDLRPHEFIRTVWLVTPEPLAMVFVIRAVADRNPTNSFPSCFVCPLALKI